MTVAVSIEIPRIFHQVWVGSEPLPKEDAGYQQTWLRHHPAWELRFWTDENLPAGLRRPEAYERLRSPVERCDLLRLELVCMFGGVYVDTDFECLRSLEPLLDGVDFFCGYTDPGRVNTALMGAVPGHALLVRALDEIRPRDVFGYDKHATGPIFVNRLLSEYPDATIFEQDVFYPRTPDTTATAYAVHHARRSWKEPEDLLLDARRAEQRLALARDELARMEKRYELAREEAEALRRQLRGECYAGFRTLALRLRRLAIRRAPRGRVRYTLGTLRRRLSRR